MSLARNYKRLWAWFLATLMFSSLAGGLFVRLSPARAACATAAHTCCCVASGLTKCACSGHAGLPAQLASLTTCSDANPLPVFVISAPPALLPEASATYLALQPRSITLPPELRCQPLDAPAPSPPPPQASL